MPIRLGGGVGWTTACREEGVAASACGGPGEGRMLIRPGGGVGGTMVCREEGIAASACGGPGGGGRLGGHGHQSRPLGGGGAEGSCMS